jgi:hypothetical protein
VATVVAMLWVSWLGREGRGEIDREVAVRRLGEAISKPSRFAGSTRERRSDERGTGVAVRPSSRPSGRPSVSRSGSAGDSDTRRAS